MRKGNMAVLKEVCLLWLGLVFCLCLGSPLLAQIQDEPKNKKSQEVKKEAEPEDKKKEKKEKKKEDRYLALLKGDVYTLTGPVLRETDILVKNGVIQRLGQNLELPEACETLEVQGMRVYPGLVAVASSRILGKEPPENSTDLFSLNMVLALAGGLTTVVTGNTAAKLTYGTTEGMVLKRDLFFPLSFSRNAPQKRYDLKKDLTRVRGYMRDLAEYEAQKSRGLPDVTEPDKKWIKGKYEKYYKLLMGEIVAKASAHNSQDLRELADLSRRFGFKLVIDGGSEAWTLADELGRAEVQVIFTPRRKAREDKRKSKPTGWNMESARILYESGINFAILPVGRRVSLGGITGRDLMALPMEAAFAIKGGLPEQAALEAITIGAARVLGLQGRIGSIEEGKDGDFLVCDGDLLHYNTLVQWTIVNGRVVYDKEKESLFAHIRPRDGKEGKIIEFWPRPVDTMPDFEDMGETPPPEEEGRESENSLELKN